MVDLAVLLLVLTSFPVGILGLADYRSSKRIGAVFSMAASAWSIAGVLLISAGVPGLIFFPVMLVMMLVGDVFDYHREKNRFTILKAFAVSAILILVTVGLVVL